MRTLDAAISDLHPAALGVPCAERKWLVARLLRKPTTIGQELGLLRRIRQGLDPNRVPRTPSLSGSAPCGACLRTKHAGLAAIASWRERVGRSPGVRRIDVRVEDEECPEPKDVCRANFCKGIGT